MQSRVIWPLPFYKKKFWWLLGIWFNSLLPWNHPTFPLEPSHFSPGTIPLFPWNYPPFALESSHFCLGTIPPLSRNQLTSALKQANLCPGTRTSTLLPRRCSDLPGCCMVNSNPRWSQHNTLPCQEPPLPLPFQARRCLPLHISSCHIPSGTTTNFSSQWFQTLLQGASDPHHTLHWLSFYMH